jgi:hypothetical protein
MPPDMDILARLVLLLGTALLTTPPTFPAADPTVPPGSHTELCPWFRSGAKARTASLVLPDRYSAQDQTHDYCEWAGGGVDVFLTLSADEDLATYRAEQIDPFVGDDGDDGIEDTVTYQSGVPVYGSVTGEVLTYQPYNDGSPLDVTVVQANGVRLEVDASRGDLAKRRAAFDRARASLAVAAGNRDSCTARGHTITYELPRGVRDVTSYGGPCVLYLRPGRGLGHLATFTVAPRHPGPAPAPNLHVAERDGFRLVWKTPAERWPAERKLFRTLLRSVHPGQSVSP